MRVLLLGLVTNKEALTKHSIWHDPNAKFPKIDIKKVNIRSSVANTCTHLQLEEVHKESTQSDIAQYPQYYPGF